MWSCNKIYSTGNHLQFILIRNCTKMTTLPTLCITGKLDYIDDRIDGPITMFRYLTFQEVINKIEISVSISAMN